MKRWHTLAPLCLVFLFGLFECAPGEVRCQRESDCPKGKSCVADLCLQRGSEVAVRVERASGEFSSTDDIEPAPMDRGSGDGREQSVMDDAGAVDRSLVDRAKEPKADASDAGREVGSEPPPRDTAPPVPTYRTCDAAHTVNTKLPTPKVVDVVEDDRLVTLYWNSKTATYDPRYNPDLKAGIHSYLVEWGEVGQPFTWRAPTSYRVMNLQPLAPGKTYQARIYGLDDQGRRSAPSQVVTFKHDPTRVDGLRKSMNGFFVDFNEPMGPFDEREWNNAYSGCVGEGEGGQFINPQFHAHNILASLQCDRGVTNSRIRGIFDFRNREGTMVFDVDGGVRRNIFYLDLLPEGRKRDITGHVALDTTRNRADPPHLLRLVQNENTIKLRMSNASGQIQDVPDSYRNGACGRDLRFCKGENLLTVKNVRRRFRLKISKDRYRVWINDILVIDASLRNALTPSGLPYERAQVIWLHFSYNTPKANIRRALLHWDNFGFDAPAGFKPPTVVHNYTNGLVGPKKGRYGGPSTSPTSPYKTIVPIPDALVHTDKKPVLKAELMFTMQGGFYKWARTDHVMLNGHKYPVPQPSSQITALTLSQLVNAYIPYSVLMPIDPTHLKQGQNTLTFHFGPVNVFNVHVELTFEHDKAPDYTQPAKIFSTYGYRPAMIRVGPGIVFSSLGTEQAWTWKAKEPRGYAMANAVSGKVPFSLRANSISELTSTGVVKGIVLYDIYIDRKLWKTVRVDTFAAPAGFAHEHTWDTSGLCNGEHEIGLLAYNREGTPSYYDGFLATSKMGEYRPVFVTVNNRGGRTCAGQSHRSGPVPTPRTPAAVKALYQVCPTP